jgi:subtilisin
MSVNLKMYINLICVIILLFTLLSKTYSLSPGIETIVNNTDIQTILKSRINLSDPKYNLSSIFYNGSGGQIIPNRYILTLKGNISDPRILASGTASDLSSIGLKVLPISNLTNSITVSIPDDIIRNNSVIANVLAENATALCDVFLNSLSVKSCEPDTTIVAHSTPLGHASSQIVPTGIDRIDGEITSAKLINGNADVDIAIVDSGVNPHPDLNIAHNVSFVPNKNTDDCGHGTHVSGIAAAKDDEGGVMGMAPGARIWSVKVLSQEFVFMNGNLQITCTGSMSGIIQGIDYVTSHADEIDVVNLSLGCECFSPALEDAITKSLDHGLTYVVSAGNDKKDAVTYVPAKIPGVITVSAITDTDGRCGSAGNKSGFRNMLDDTFAIEYSNFGDIIDLAAPGTDILSTSKDSALTVMSGTSMAAPHVTGLAAVYKSNHLERSPSEVLNFLISTASSPLSQCNNQGLGYFSGDPDQFEEPLIHETP